MPREPFNPALVKAPLAEKSPGVAGPITVSQLTALVKQALEAALPATVHVVGEISNLKRHSSGHLYLTLKDAFSELACVMWRSQAGALRFDPTDGLEVIATGRVEVFERAGRYQLYIRKLEPRGVGALELAFRQVCARLEAEGLFDPRHKKPLPTYPERIAVVTSPTGAAIADILRTIGRRYPCVEVLLYPVAVQGDRANVEIATAIRTLNAHASQLGGVDLMIVGRGGGSMEDLWAFNEEVVARAIHASRIPIISAVGHEVDVTVADLVADIRAATPTAAAELAVPVLDEVQADIAAHAGRIARAMAARTALGRTELSGIVKRPVFAEPTALIFRREQTLDWLSQDLRRSIASSVRCFAARVDTLGRTVQRIAPHIHMARTAVRLHEASHRLKWAVVRRWQGAERALGSSVGALDAGRPSRRLPALKDATDRIARALALSMQHRLAVGREGLRREQERLAGLSYRSVLDRGFSITRRKKGRAVIRSRGELRDRERVVTELADGEFESEVVNLKQLELFE